MAVSPVSSIAPSRSPGSRNARAGRERFVYRYVLLPIAMLGVWLVMGGCDSYLSLLYPEEFPAVLTTAATEITTTEATLNGSMERFGKNLESESDVFFCLSTSPADLAEGPVQRGYMSAQGGTLCRPGTGSVLGPGPRRLRVTGLQSNTTYYYKAVAFWGTKNSDGHSSGEIQSFTTLATPPTLSTGAVSGITSSGATVAGTIASEGSGRVTERGICYGTSPNPTRSGTCAVSGSGPGSFSAALSGLTPDTRYNARAFATWGGGVAYGSDVAFTTLPLIPPGFTLTAASTSQLVERGTTGAAFAVGVARVGGFSGAVTLTVTGLPAGVTATVQSPGTGNSGSVAFVVSKDAALGTSRVTLVGSAAGLEPRSVPFDLIVADPPGLTLSVPQKLDMTIGGSATVSLGIFRTGGWTGSVSLAIPNLPAGITASFTPQTTAGNTALLNLAIGSSVLEGSYLIEVRATGSVGVSTSAAILVLVSP
jgi:hypothetical protein